MSQRQALSRSRRMLTAAVAVMFRQFVMTSLSDNFLVKRLGYFADCNALDGVPKVDGFFSLYPREGGELSSVLYSSTNASFPRLADFMSVSQTTAPGEFFKWAARDSFLPVVTAGQRAVFLDDEEALRAIISTNFDGRSIVL